jgi:hypothetical protein
MSWRELVHVRIDEPLSLSLTLGWPVLLLVLLAGVLPFTPPVRRRIDRWRAEEMDVAFGGIKIHVKRTNEVIRIAHAAWTEVVTRKAAIPYDPADDLIVEIYDSWYALFTELRALTRSVPAEQLRRSQDARETRQPSGGCPQPGPPAPPDEVPGAVPAMVRPPHHRVRHRTRGPGDPVGIPRVRRPRRRLVTGQRQDGRVRC